MDDYSVDGRAAVVVVVLSVSSYLFRVVLCVGHTLFGYGTYSLCEGFFIDCLRCSCHDPSPSLGHGTHATSGEPMPKFS